MKKHSILDLLMRRYFLPILSGILLALTFYPFFIWPFALVGLAPLLYFSAQPTYSRKEIFWWSFIAGGISVSTTLYASLFQLAMQPGAQALTYAVRASSIFFFVFIGALFGVAMLTYRTLRGHGVLLDSLLAASLYTLIELLLFPIFGGYYYASLAHALVPFPPALLVASLGGVPLVIFVAAWVNASLVQRSWRLIFGSLLFIAAACICSFWYGQTYATTGKSLPVATIQRLPQSLIYVTAPAPKPFSDYGLQELIAKASDGGKTTLVVYPFSPVEVAYIGEHPTVEEFTSIVPDQTLGVWLRGFVPASTTVMLWNMAARQGSLYDEFEFWDNSLRQTYQKRILHTLSDYTPQWMRSLGLARVPYTLTPGAESEVSVAGVKIRGLACSELQQERYARGQAIDGNILLAVGFDGFFPGSMASNWSLKTARLRAAENGLPVIRANIFGPSALINADGSIQKQIAYNKAGILAGSVSIQKIPTVYAYSGSLPICIFIVAILLYLFILRINYDFNTCRGG